MTAGTDFSSLEARVANQERAFPVYIDGPIEIIPRYEEVEYRSDVPIAELDRVYTFMKGLSSTRLLLSGRVDGQWVIRRTRPLSGPEYIWFPWKTGPDATGQYWRSGPAFGNQVKHHMELDPEHWEKLVDISDRWPVQGMKGAVYAEFEINLKNNPIT